MWDNLCQAAEEAEDSEDELCVSTHAGVFRRRFFPVFVSDTDFRVGPGGTETGLWPIHSGLDGTVPIDVQWANAPVGSVAIPITPIVMTYRVEAPDYLVPSPWPLNQISLDPDDRGYGGRPAKRVYLDALRILGQIRVPEQDRQY